MTQPYVRRNTGGWRPTSAVTYIAASATHRVTVEQSVVKPTTTVHAHGFTSWTWSTCRRRLVFSTPQTSRGLAARTDMADMTNRSLVNYSVRQATRSLRASDDNLFVERGRTLAVALHQPMDTLAKAATVAHAAPYAARTRNFAVELCTCSALVGKAAGATSDACAACAHVGVYAMDSVAHMLTTCEVTKELYRWAMPLLLSLLDYDYTVVSDDDENPFSPTGFSRLLAFGGDLSLMRHPGCVAVRGACLTALRAARNDQHAHDSDSDVHRRADEDEIDLVLGMLPSAPVTADVGGWDHDRLVVRAARELQAHITTDWFCANGGYHARPGARNLRGMRPSSIPAFRDLWGSVCNVPADRAGDTLRFAF